MQSGVRERETKKGEGLCLAKSLAIVSIIWKGWWAGWEESLGEGRTPALGRKGQSSWWLETDNAGVQKCVSHDLQDPSPQK